MLFEKLNETNCRICDIKENDKVPIGGSFPSKLDLLVTVDTDKFKDLFECAEKTVITLQKNEKNIEWFKEIASNFDSKIFMQMYVFDHVLRKMYPDLSKNVQQRQNFYDIRGSRTLSQAFQKGVCQCAEIALLAQLFLQRQGIASKYFGGELVHSLKDEKGEPHSFITFVVGTKDYVYDPSNPMLSSGRYFPRISSVEMTDTHKKQFEKQIHIQTEGRNSIYFETKNILTGSKWYYGCGDGGDFFPSLVLSQNKEIATNLKNVLSRT